MIDISTEQILSLSEAASRLPRRRQGKKPHVATLYRWAQRGLKGVRLETIHVGGTECTSVEAMQRFFELISRRQAEATVPPPQFSRSRLKQIEAAEKELERAGI